MHHSDPLTHRIQDGVLRGSVVGVGLTIVAATIYALVGPEAWAENAPASLIAFVTLYLTGGVVIGGAWGAIQPMRRTLHGTVVGFAIVAALATGALFWVIGTYSRRPVDLPEIALFMLLAGGIVGPMLGVYDWGRRARKHWAEPYWVAVLTVLGIVRVGGADVLTHVFSASWSTIGPHVWPIALGGTCVLAFRVWQRAREVV